MTDPMNRTEAIEWLKLQLGGGSVVIELLQEHFDTAFNDALRWYAARKGIQRRAVVNLVPGIVDYVMPDDCDVVFQVVFPGVALDIIGTVNPYAFIDVDQVPVAYSSISGVPGGSFYGTFKLILQHAETARRIVGSEPAWEYDKGTNTVHVYPNAQRSGAMVAYYLSTVVVTEDPVAPAVTPVNDFRRRMTFRDRDIILRYAHAKTKWMLARVRGKYTDGMPSAGGSKNLDDDTLLGEAQGEIEALNEEIKALSEPVPFITG
ncbi:MAG: hypothetical protein LC118_18545 [Dehalococcoidia bacterium]|nr:hypothetical protein [Dehalococcoidia bacterium]